MLSSLSRLIPNHLNPLEADIFKRDEQQQQTHHSSATSTTDDLHEDLEHASGPADGTSHTKTRSDATDATTPHKSRKRKDPVSSETFIIVRPPPAKNNHPLNLQVQLVPNPNRGDRASRRSVDLNASRETLTDTVDVNASSVGLTRTASIRSNRSNRSDAESSYSTSSTASTSSTTSTLGGRRIIPLYNLHAHNVLTNSITDAGTDAKVAKFFKRGMEIMGLAILEPIEVFGSYSWDAEEELALTFGGGLADGIPRLSISGHTSALAPPAPDLSTVIEVPSPATPATPATTATPAKSETSSKKFFGKLFKKKEAPVTPLALTPAVTPPPPIVTSPPTQEPTGIEPVLQPQVLGLHSILRSQTLPPRGRPTAYVWIIRKWIKGSGESWLDGMADSVGGALGMKDGTEQRNAETITEVEVRFEWKRAKNKDAEKRASRRNSTAVPDGEEENKTRRHSSVIERRSTASLISSSENTNSVSHEENPPAEGGLARSPSLLKKQNRLSMQGLLGRSKPQPPAPSQTHLAPSVPSRAASPIGGASILTNTSTEERAEPEEAEDSDIEDSETPWHCTLHLRTRKPSRRGSHISMIGPDEPAPVQSKPKRLLKLKIATLAPAPHHPKVIAQVKTVYPMPDVAVDSAQVRPRNGGALPKEKFDELVLTAEEIKDVISCTGLWVVVREGYGGLAKRRKGDGWLIRG